MSEIDQRLNILNAVLTTPHRKLELAQPFHAETVVQDPIFYSHLAVWYFKKGEIRDQKECFIINLILSKFPGHRDVGLALLSELPPHQVVRVVRFIKGFNERTKEKLPQKKGVKKEEGTSKVKPKIILTPRGLGRNIPTSMVTEITRYLRARESDNTWLDTTVISQKNNLRYLYSTLHIKPSDRADKLIFKNQPPEDSRVAELKNLANLTDPTEIAKLIIKLKIPYRIATSFISEMTAPVILALIEVMSPQELMNSIASLERRGVMENPILKTAVEEKLKTLKKSKKVTALKTDKAVGTGVLSEETKKALTEVKDTQIKNKGKITKDIAIFVDKSLSMTKAIEVGKQIAAMVSAISTKNLFVYAFDTVPYPITSKGPEMSHWEKAFLGIRPGGGTSCGCPFVAMTKNQQKVDQVIIVTDGGDNSYPLFHVAYKDYVRFNGSEPSVCVVKIPSSESDSLTKACQEAKINVDTYKVENDYVSLPAILPFLSSSTKLDLIMEILETELPSRKV